MSNAKVRHRRRRRQLFLHKRSWRARLELLLRREGITGMRIYPGPHWSQLTEEQQTQELFKFLIRVRKDSKPIDDLDELNAPEGEQDEF